MKHLLIVLLVVVSSLTLFRDAATAEDPASRRQVEELLMLMDADAMVEGIYSQTDQMLQELADQMQIQPSEKVLFDGFVNRIASTMKSDLSWAKMKEPMIDLYLKHYTDQEIADITAFYKTPSGQSLLKKMPLVTADSLAISQRMMRDTFPKIQGLLEELEAEIKKLRDGR